MWGKRVSKFSSSQADEFANATREPLGPLACSASLGNACPMPLGLYKSLGDFNHFFPSRCHFSSLLGFDCRLLWKGSHCNMRTRVDAKAKERSLSSSAWQASPLFHFSQLPVFPPISNHSVKCYTLYKWY